MVQTYCIAGLYVNMDTWGQTLEHAKPYQTNGEVQSHIIIEAKPEYYKSKETEVSDDLCEYMATGADFYMKLLQYNGLMIHSSAIVMEGKAYLFSAPSGTGKSTHTELWRKTFGEDKVYYLNDDKPALRLENNTWYAYGTPWSGKNNLSRNEKVPLGGIAILERSENNEIVPLSGAEAVFSILDQTYRPKGAMFSSLLLERVDQLVSLVSIWKLRCNMDPQAAIVAYEGMKG